MTPEPAAVGAPEDGETTARLKGLAGLSQDDLCEAIDLFLKPEDRAARNRPNAKSRSKEEAALCVAAVGQAQSALMELDQRLRGSRPSEAAFSVADEIMQVLHMHAGLQISGLKFQSLNSNARELELTNLLGLVLGCIEANICK